MADLGITISQLVEMYLPTGFVVGEDFIENQTRIYQLLYWEAAGVTEENKYTITEYPDTWQLLIGYMVLYSILQKILLGSFIGAIGGTTSTGEIVTEGGIKKIVTGPTEVEYFGAADSLSTVVKAIQGDGGLLLEIMGLACPIAARIGIKLPFCKAMKMGIAFDVVYPPTNPFGFKQLHVGGDYDKPSSMG